MLINDASVRAGSLTLFALSVISDQEPNLKGGETVTGYMQLKREYRPIQSTDVKVFFPSNAS